LPPVPNGEVPPVPIQRLPPSWRPFCSLSRCSNSSRSFSMSSAWIALRCSSVRLSSACGLASHAVSC